MRKARFFLSAGLCLVMASPAFAQDADSADTAATTASPAAPARAADTGGVEEILVTAQRREERLQDVPIAITAVTASAIEEKGIDTLVDLPRITPGLTITKENSTPLTFIRGIGSPSSGGQEAAVATYVDGVYLYLPQSTVFNLANIERVEILKGPQGTLFGRNATAGVINIVTRTPNDEPGLELKLGYSSFDTVEASAYLTGGIAPNVAADLTLYYRDQGKGWGTNLATGTEVYKSKEFAVRSKWVWEPAAGTRITAIGDYSESSGTAGIASRFIAPSRGIDGLDVPADFYDVRANLDPDSDNTYRGVSVTINQDLGFADLVSISGYRHDESFLVLDQDQSIISSVNADLYQSSKQFTQELQLVSNGGGPIDWIVGLYYLKDTFNFRSSLSGAAFAPRLRADLSSFQHTESYSAFFQSGIELGPRTKLTVGGRYTIDDRSLDASQVNTNTGGVTTVIFPEQSVKFKKPTWRISLDHKLADDFLVYASYNRGFRAGTYNPSSPTNPVVQPEILDAYEVGFKSDLFDRKLRLNGSAFLYDISNLQLQANNLGVVVLFNAASARIKGFELTAEASPTRNFSIQAGISVLDGEYTDFPTAIFFTPRPTGGASQTVFDATGKTTLRTPKFTGSIGAQYRIETAAGDIKLAADYYYNDGFFAGPQNMLRQPSYDVTNVSLAFAPSDQLELKFWGRNIFGTEYYTRIGESGVGYVGSPAAPATYGVELSAKF